MSMQIFIPLLLFFALHTFSQVYPLKHRNPTTTKVIEKRKKENPSLEIKSTWIPLESIPPYLVESVFFVEDQNFYSHHGISLRKIRSAYYTNKHIKKASYGGSTITQQVAKNLFLHGRKTYRRKMHEAFLALLMETYLSKNRILEIYLNIVELGPGIFGFEEGGKYWFGKPIHDLTGKESVQLAMILSDPLYRDPKKLSSNLEGLANHLLTLLASKGMISHEELLNSLFLPRAVRDKVDKIQKKQ